MICVLDSETDEYVYNTLDDTDEDATKLVLTLPSSAHDPSDCRSQTTETEIHDIKTDTDGDKAQYINNATAKQNTNTDGSENSSSLCAELEVKALEEDYYMKEVFTKPKERLSSVFDSEEQNTDSAENKIVDYSTSTNGYEIQPRLESYEEVYRSADLSQHISDKYSLLELKKHFDLRFDCIEKHISSEVQRLSVRLKDNSGLVQMSDHENNYSPVQLFSVHTQNPRAHIFKPNYRTNFGSVLSAFESGVFSWPSEFWGIPEMPKE